MPSYAGSIFPDEKKLSRMKHSEEINFLLKRSFRMCQLETQFHCINVGISNCGNSPTRKSIRCPKHKLLASNNIRHRRSPLPLLLLGFPKSQDCHPQMRKV